MCKFWLENLQRETTKRPVHSSEDNIKVDHKAIGRKVVKWVYLA